MATIIDLFGPSSPQTQGVDATPVCGDIPHFDEGMYGGRVRMDESVAVAIRFPVRRV